MRNGAHVTAAPSASLNTHQWQKLVLWYRQDSFQTYRISSTNVTTQSLQRFSLNFEMLGASIIELTTSSMTKCARTHAGPTASRTETRTSIWVSSRVTWPQGEICDSNWRANSSIWSRKADHLPIFCAIYLNSGSNHLRPAELHLTTIDLNQHWDISRRRWVWAAVGRVPSISRSRMPWTTWTPANGISSFFRQYTPRSILNYSSLLPPNLYSSKIRTTNTTSHTSIRYKQKHTHIYAREGATGSYELAPCSPFKHSFRIAIKF